MNRRVLFLAGVAGGMLLGLATLGAGNAHAGTIHPPVPKSSPANGAYPSSPAHSSYPSKCSSKPCVTKTPATKTSTVSVPPALQSATAAPTPTGGTSAPSSLVPAVSVQTEQLGTAVHAELARTGPGWLPTAIKFGLMLLGVGGFMHVAGWLGRRRGDPS